MRLTSRQEEALISRTVQVLLKLRAQFLAEYPKQALTHWDQLSTRMKVATATARDVPTWFEKMMSGLRLTTPSAAKDSAGNSLSSRLFELEEEVRVLERPRYWLALLRHEHSYIMALVRADADDLREQRNAAKAKAAEMVIGTQDGAE